MTRTPGDGTGVDTVVLIHDLWLTPRCWDDWVGRYRRAGYRVLAPAWPGLESGVERLRHDQVPIARLTTARVVDHYDRILRGLNSRPFLLGHGFGGAFVQVLLDRGLGAAGVAVNPVPVRGVVRLPWRTLRSLGPLLARPGNRHRAVPLSPERFHELIANRLTAERSDGYYERQHVPGAGRVLFEVPLANLRRRGPYDVDFGNDRRPPLLLVGGGADILAPPVLTRSAAAHHRRSTAVTGYREYPGRGHLTIAEPGWEQVADFALEWLSEAVSRAGVRSAR